MAGTLGSGFPMPSQWPVQGDTINQLERAFAPLINQEFAEMGMPAPTPGAPTESPASIMALHLDISGLFNEVVSMGMEGAPSPLSNPALALEAQYEQAQFNPQMLQEQTLGQQSMDPNSSMSLSDLQSPSVANLDFDVVQGPDEVGNKVADIASFDTADSSADTEEA